MKQCKYDYNELYQIKFLLFNNVNYEMQCNLEDTKMKSNITYAIKQLKLIR